MPVQTSAQTMGRLMMELAREIHKLVESKKQRELKPALFERLLRNMKILVSTGYSGPLRARGLKLVRDCQRSRRVLSRYFLALARLVQYCEQCAARSHGDRDASAVPAKICSIFLAQLEELEGSLRQLSIPSASHCGAKKSCEELALVSRRFLGAKCLEESSGSLPDEEIQAICLKESLTALQYGKRSSSNHFNPLLFAHNALRRLICSLQRRVQSALEELEESSTIASESLELYYPIFANLLNLCSDIQCISSHFLAEEGNRKRLQHTVQLMEICVAQLQYRQESRLPSTQLALLARAALVLELQLSLTANIVVSLRQEDTWMKQYWPRAVHDILVEIREVEARSSYSGFGAVNAIASRKVFAALRSEIAFADELISTRGHGVSAAVLNDELFKAINALSKLAFITDMPSIHRLLLQIGRLLTLYQERSLSFDEKLISILESVLSFLRNLPSLSREHLPQYQRTIWAIQRSVYELHWTLNKEELTHCKQISQRLADAGSLPANINSANWPDYLARNIHQLLSSPTLLVKTPICGKDFQSLSAKIQLELRILLIGAACLGVHRVAEAAEMLLVLHQSISSNKGQGCVDALEALLVDAHLALRTSLNQAAARKRVCYSRDIAGRVQEVLQSPRLCQRESAMDKSLLIEFIEEACQRANEIALYYRKWVSAIGVGEQADTASNYLHIVLRQLHTLKGSAGIFASDDIVALCHRCERLLLNASSEDVEAGFAERSQDLLQELDNLLAQLNVAVGQLSKKCGLESDVMLREPSDVDAYACGSKASFSAIELFNKLFANYDALTQVIRPDNAYERSTQRALLEKLLQEYGESIEQIRELFNLSHSKSFISTAHRLQALLATQSLSAGKEVSLLVENSECEAEAGVVNLLQAPLEHLVRNALDHGIEDAETRLASAKPSRGVIRLSFGIDKSQHLRIELTDDGRGVKGVGDGSNSAESLAAISRLGFTTKERATEVSGHGLGLRAVCDTLNSMRGHLDMHSVAGKGTRFTITVPMP
ncbi:MAG: ATP-binding protein [Pseudohongiellaceae bacterium]|nr:ATP-binding protein [Pseudohongiellaceae bacterium]